MAGVSGASPEGGLEPTVGRRRRLVGLRRPGGHQLNVPGWPITGTVDGIGTAPPSQHGAASQAGAQAGSQAGAAGAEHGADCPPAHGDRNSMNDGRRQPPAPPRQLLQPGAAARVKTAIARHIARAMMSTSTATDGAGEAGPHLRRRHRRR